MRKSYHSCYIVDVQLTEQEIILVDSSNKRFFIDMKNDIGKMTFKSWFQDIFLNGIPQKLTVFEYTIEELDTGECISKIQKIITQKAKTQ